MLGHVLGTLLLVAGLVIMVVGIFYLVTGTWWIIVVGIIVFAMGNYLQKKY